MKTGNKRDWKDFERGPKPPKRASVSFANDGTKTAILVSDSFGRYIKDDGLLGEQVGAFEPVYECSAEPHSIGKISSDANKFNIIMNCYGGAKLEECMNEGLARRIMFVKPHCILFMLGMCDLATINKQDYSPNPKWFFETIMEVKRKFNRLTENNIENEEDKRYREDVIFHFATLQNWGESWAPLSKDYISREDVVKLRRKNVSYVQQKQGQLWEWHRILLVDLNVHPNTRRDSIHYSEESTQELFEKIKKVCMRYMCVKPACRMTVALHPKAIRRDVVQRGQDLTDSPSCQS